MSSPGNEVAEIREYAKAALMAVGMDDPEGFGGALEQVALRWGDGGVGAFLFFLGRAFAVAAEEHGAPAPEDGGFYQLVVVN
ncbi:hypothetical protein [Actinopolymorpha alba]|uniref:hypothetical protein n=1 Tax=Actinopolymorpha alba TaxID=533267 RepID=UPI00036B57CA|nr:hypothetical protein [Actinopolymorpha alba]